MSRGLDIPRIKQGSCVPQSVARGNILRRPVWLLGAMTVILLLVLNFGIHKGQVEALSGSDSGSRLGGGEMASSTAGISGTLVEADDTASPPSGQCDDVSVLWEPDNGMSPSPAASGEDLQQITMLTYNTHLFGGSQVCIFKPSACYQDETRASHIVDQVSESGADIVALQEVWEDSWGLGVSWQQEFVDELAGVYPYAWYANGCPGAAVDFMVGSGLVLLSKLPLQDLSFHRFPTYDYEAFPSDNDYWATKGVIAATAMVGDPPQPIRIGLSHALTGSRDQTSKWDDAYVGTAITPFELNGQPY
ncbi:MAG: endonuclease/exonuclease/phosphatase family protein, partial [Chloroflexota bacterium]